MVAICKLREIFLCFPVESEEKMFEEKFIRLTSLGDGR